MLRILHDGTINKNFNPHVRFITNLKNIDKFHNRKRIKKDVRLLDIGTTEKNIINFHLYWNYTNIYLTKPLPIYTMRWLCISLCSMLCLNAEMRFIKTHYRL